MASSTDYRQSKNAFQSFCKAALYAVDERHAPAERASALAFMANVSVCLETCLQIDYEYMPYLYLARQLDSDNVDVAFEVMSNYGKEPDDHTDREFFDQAIECLARNWPLFSKNKKEMIRGWLDRVRNQGVDGLPAVFWKSE